MFRTLCKKRRMHYVTHWTFEQPHRESRKYLNKKCLHKLFVSMFVLLFFLYYARRPSCLHVPLYVLDC